MTRDAFHNDILKRLEDEFDPQLFEACMCDILRVDHPTLAAVKGGADGGMDGAIADVDGAPILLTTAAPFRA